MATVLDSRISWLRAALTGLAAATLSLLALAPAGALAQFAGVRPIVNCIQVDELNPAEVMGVFGYHSSYESNVTRTGDANFFFPGNYNRGQPTVFSPGLHDRIFATVWNVHQIEELTWYVDGYAATASLARSPRCDSPTPTWRGTWDGTESYRGADLVFYGGSSWITTGPVSGAGSPPGMAGSPWQLFAQGGAAGADGTDGATGPRGERGPQGDAGPTGPTGEQGAQGAPGANGANGRDGVAQQVFPSPRTHRFSTRGRRRISDPNVTEQSVVTIQYVDGAGGVPTSVDAQRDGSFVATGTPRRKFRYVVYNPPIGG